VNDLSDKTAVVTGGGSGIGGGIVLALAAAGVNVAVADIDGDAASRMADQARSLGVSALSVRTDVSSYEEVRQLHTAARERFGDVHILCNNAGVSVMRRGVNAEHADWEWVIGVNLWGVIHGMEAFLPGMLASGAECHIVNTASMNGLFASARSAMYSASKYGVVGLTETYRNELAGTPVRVSVLCPAAVRSRIDESERNRPAHLRAGTDAPAFVPSAAYDISAAREPGEAGELVVDAIRRKQFYIFTDVKIAPYLQKRHEEMLAALDAVRQWDERHAG
jgi:NAD(P)-dependent dehydrogenase (short-subunit alcohol dehydrogenase family)